MAPKTQEPVERQPVQVPCLRNPPHDDLRARLASGQFVWVDYEGPTDQDLTRLSELIDLHPLTLEDARTFDQRPKIEEHDGYVFMVVFGVDAQTESGGALLREVHMIISGDYVVTIHQDPFRPLGDLRTRYDTQRVQTCLPATPT